MSGGLKGYKILSKHHTAKSVMYFVRRWGKKYVVKEYTDYRFRDHGHGEEMTDALRRAQNRTEVYFKHLQKVARLMRRSLRQDGLLNIPLDVFRQEQSIYKVSRQLDASDIEFERLHELLDFKQLNVFLRTMLVQLDQLEKIGFIHCDLKPENVVICCGRSGVYSAAIIDCDSGIIIGNDDTHYVDYTPEYAAPELHDYKRREAEDDEDAEACRAQLSCAADMFSAACLILCALTGNTPDEYGRIPAVVMEADRILWVEKIHPVWRTMVRQTLQAEPEKRLHAAQFLDVLALAEKNGLMEELQKPFDGVGEGEVIECGRQQVMMLSRGGRNTALWYVDDLWLADKNVQSVHVLSEHDQRVRMKRAQLQAICEQINSLCSEGGVLYPIAVKEIGRRFFIEQQLPPGRCMVLSELTERLSTENADKVMGDLLKAVKAIQQKGLNCCLLDTDDVWLMKQTDGSILPMLTGLHKLFASEQLPEPEQLDVYPYSAAPEVCLYLGTGNAEIREAVAALINERSTMFNLGMMYHVLLSGQLPQMTDEEEVLPGEAVWNGQEDISALLLDGGIDERRRSLIESMLECEIEDRPKNCDALIRMLHSFRSEGRQIISPKRDECRNDIGAPLPDEEEVGWDDEWEEVPQEASGDAEHDSDPELVDEWEDVPGQPHNAAEDGQKDVGDEWEEVQSEPLSDVQTDSVSEDGWEDVSQDHGAIFGDGLQHDASAEDELIEDEDLSDEDESLSDEDEDLSDEDGSLSDEDESLSDEDEDLSDEDEDLSDEDEDLSDEDEDLSDEDEDLFDEDEWQEISSAEDDEWMEVDAAESCFDDADAAAEMGEEEPAEDELMEDDPQQQEMLGKLSELLAQFAESRRGAEADVPEETEPDEEHTVCLMTGDRFAGWHEIRWGVDGEKAWAHGTGREAFDDARQAERVRSIVRRTQAIAEACENVMPVEQICKADAAQLYSVVKSDQGRFWCMADDGVRTAVDTKLIDEWMKLIVRGVQAAHEQGLLCGAVTAENTAVPCGELQINIAEYAVAENDEQDMRMWRKWMQPWRIGSAQKRATSMAGAYLSPEAERFLAGADEKIDKASDIFSLGMLYHVFWCGELPEIGSGKGGWSGALAGGEQLRLNLQIPFAQRCLMERMLSAKAAERPQSCQKVIAEIENILLKRGKTHSVTVKRNSVPVAEKTVLLYTEVDGKAKYVAKAVTDKQGRAVFTGYLPEGKYYVDYDGEKANCRWRNF